MVTFQSEGIIDVNNENYQEFLLQYFYYRHNVNRVNLEHFINRRGLILTEVPVDELAEFDHDHFGKKEATDICLAHNNINNQSKILDIGSGFGGPARYIVHKTGCTICGIEIQKERQEEADWLNRQMGFSKEQINMVLGDANTAIWNGQHEKKYTHVISFLSILHMVRKKEILEKLGSVLKDNGQVFIEDYCLGTNPATKKELLETVSCPGLLSYEDYIAALRKGGIEVDVEEDLTESWKEMARQRNETYCKAKENPEIVNLFIADCETIPHASCLYESIYKLFERGAIRGIRIIGTKSHDTGSFKVF